jgi:hypothetical protein
LTGWSPLIRKRKVVVAGSVVYVCPALISH